MADAYRLAGRTALVTGAASGIGRATAVTLARRGCHLALADLDTDGLESVRLECAGLGSRASVHQLDVADREAVAALPGAVLASHPGVDILMNNAGVALGGRFENVTAEDFDWLFEINFGGVVRMTRAFMPLLRKSDDARIVNVSSVFGLVAPPGQVAYAASKFAVRGFSEALRHELAGSTIGVTQVHPGGVATNISERARISGTVNAEDIERARARFKRALKLPPEVAGETIVRGIERRRDFVLVGKDAVAIALLARLFPVSYWKLIGLGMPR